MNRFLLLASLVGLFSACQKDEDLTCVGGLSGTMFRKTALSDFPVCGDFGLQENPDISATQGGETIVFGKKYFFENVGEPFESVYYLRGEVSIYRRDSSDYTSQGFNFDFGQLAIPQTDKFEDHGMVVTLTFSHDKNNPGHQGPVQYIDWIDWRIRFQKEAGTDRVTGSFFSDRGTFWIPGPSSNSDAGLDLMFSSQ